MDIYRKILSFIDLTTLEGTDNQERIHQLCLKALSFSALGMPSPAAVCVYPPFVRQAKKELRGSGIKIASVAGAFPSGQSPLTVREAEVAYAVEEGADEIDMVISRGKLIEGDEAFVFEEVTAIRKACPEKHLKVILETGELKTPQLIRKASEIAISAGADFIKTSTGKIQPAATPEAMQIMLEVIGDHYRLTGKKIGIKPAGGISEPAQALVYYQLVMDILGEEWLTNDLFRIGASRLADGLVAEIMKNTKTT